MAPAAIAVNMCVGIRQCVCMCLFVSAYVSMCVNLRVCVHVHLHVCTCINAHVSRFHNSRTIKKNESKPYDEDAALIMKLSLFVHKWRYLKS